MLNSVRPMPAHGEVAVIGLGKSGVAATALLRKHRYPVYVSDRAVSPSTRKSADVLRFLGSDVELGTHDLTRIAGAALLVVSPGIPPDAPPVTVAREHGVEVISEVELALRCMPRVPYIAVTGTNGKTTTTALVGALLRSLGYNVAEAGNIGTPLTEVALREPLPDWVALEVSSFQLHDTPSIDPAAGILTNLAPDHLDRYRTVEEYYADKALLFANASPASNWILNADDPLVVAMTEDVTGTRLWFSVAPPAGVLGDESVGEPTGELAEPSSPVAPLRVHARYDRRSGALVTLRRALLSRAELPLLGDHNVANALAAALAVMAVSQTHRTAEGRERIAAALREFRPPPHRLELVGEWDGVQWINDSKATNVSSTTVAVSGMTRPTVLLLGGRHKGEPYTSLAAPIRAHVKRVIAYGEAAPIVEQDLHDVVPVDRVDGDFAAVIAHARAAAVRGDAVLLSPACSSFDMFKNYEERGAIFRALAQTLGGAPGDARDGNGTRADISAGGT